jgi:hypothetical protein
MSAVTTLWRQLVQRRLWPVAILLVAALAAVPLALAKQPATQPQPPVAVADSGAKGELAQTPIVATAADGDRAKRRRVLGTRKNPFAVVKPVQAATPSGANTDGTGAPSGSNTDGSTPTGSSTPTTSTPGGGTPTTPTTPPKKKKVYDLYDLTVRFGDSAASPLPKSTLKRLQPLPDADKPVLIYMGVLKDGKTAVFLVDNNVTSTGDGDCKPSVGQCETIQIRAGETEFFDLKDDTGSVTAQYELDVLKIHKGATTSAKTARASYAGSKAGRRLLKAHVAAGGPTGYRWVGSKGTLHARPVEALGTVFARGALRLP